MNKHQNAGSLRNIFHGFRRLSPLEQIAYLKYLELVIERSTPEKRRLMRFKTKLENEISLQKTKSVQKAGL